METHGCSTEPGPGSGEKNMFEYEPVCVCVRVDDILILLSSHALTSGRGFLI